MGLDAHKTTAFDDLVNAAIAKSRVPGLAIAVIQGDDVWTKGYGFARLPDTPVTGDTLFDCASTSKSFTAAAVSLMVDDDVKYPNVKWTTPVSKLLREDFVLPDPVSTELVTLEDILSHRTGMPRHDFSYRTTVSESPDDPRSITRNLRNLPLTKPIRTTYQYNNMMYTAASYMVDILSGSTFPDFLKERIWKPLGMNDTWFGSKAALDDGVGDRLAIGYLWEKDGGEYKEVPWLIQPEGQGAGCMFSCAKDYAKWIRAMIDRSPPMSKAGHAELVKPRIFIEPESDDESMPFRGPSFYALGWGTEQYRGYTINGHDGGEEGFGSMMRYIPERKWGVVMFGNSNGTFEVAERLGWYLIEELLDVPESERTDPSHFDDKGDEEKPPFPDLRGPPLPMLAPLDAHAGTYSNPGYHELTFEIRDGRLYAGALDRTYPWYLELEHHSGGFFAANKVDVVTGDIEKIRSEFRVDYSGIVRQFGLRIEIEMGDDLIWFTRVGEDPLATDQIQE